MQPQSITLCAARTQFERSLIVRAATTQANYHSVLNNFFAYLPQIGVDPAIDPPSALLSCTLEDYYVFLVQRGHKQRGALTYVHTVQSFLRFLLRRMYITVAAHAQLLAGIREVTGPQPYPLRPVDAGIARLVVHALAKPLPPQSGAGQGRLIALRDRAIIAVLYSTALRRTELTSLDRDALHDGAAFVRGKGMRDRTVYFDRAAQDAVDLYVAARTDADPALFIRHDDGARSAERRLSAHMVGRIVKVTAAEIGLDVTAHDLRHLKARVLLAHGAQLPEVQDILGHESIETTRRVYAHYTTAHIRSAWQRCSRSAADLLDETASAKD